ncbi:MAG: hypothetical protein JW730_08690 [Anaerolineales bacterium]|nr:hypothetical protein [Anaerolineales bacterium]
MDEENTNIRPIVFEREIIKQTHITLSFHKAIGIEPPIYVFMSFIGVKGRRIETDDAVASAFHNMGIDRDILLIPDVLFETYPSNLHDVAVLLKPAFDAVWNAAGWPGSSNYDKDGTWMPNR